MSNNDERPFRVNRGGSWLDSAAGARVADRFRDTPDPRYNFLGVRLVRLLTPMQQIAEVTNAK